MTFPSHQSPTPHSPIVILGNGPSAKLVNFDHLRDGAIHSIGMNAAYRHWDRIDFRPTCYICMDTVVIQSHAQRIAELVRENRISKFFLRNEFLELFPEFSGHPRILWFDEVRAKKGSIFDTNFITTGSWSLRWAAYQGYKAAILIGIDANYVELLPEAEPVPGDKGLQLQLKETPRFNPNYFFSDYQQAGDKYNIPNDPGYREKAGGLVHVDALRRAKDDIAKFVEDFNVVDCSPVSSHGIFPKMGLHHLLSARQIALVTSFYSAAPTDEVINNAKMAIRNAGNSDLASVTVLLEGSRDELFDKIGRDTSHQLQALENQGRLLIECITQRPNYHDMFRVAQSRGQEICAVANSDILLSREFTNQLLASYAPTERPFLALTRWNRTKNGLFIQGQTGHPPWQEVEAAKIDYKSVNYLSFDLYVFDRRLVVPQELSDVLIGTFGCDTAVAALMRLSGQLVANPCLKLKIEHVDEKNRNYSSEKGQAQMLSNTEVLKQAIIRRFRSLHSMYESLSGIENLRPSYASVGTPLHRLGRWHSLTRMLGACPWDGTIVCKPVQFRKVSIHVEDARSRPDFVMKMISDVLDSGDFLELEIRGPAADQYLNCFRLHTQLRELRDRLFRYDRQSVIFIDEVSDEERVNHANVVLFAKQVLSIGSGAINATLGSAGFPLRMYEHVADIARPKERVESLSAGDAVPRVLVIDPTPVGHNSATGQLKLQLFRDFPRENIIQVCEGGGALGSLALFRADVGRLEVLAEDGVDCILSQCEQFNPQVIYLRPTNSVAILEFANALTARLRLPLVTHIMDDWPERARRKEPNQFQKLDLLLRNLLERTSVRLSISEQMSKTFSVRYGGSWINIANGVDVELHPRKRWDVRRPVSEEHPFVVRYLGGFAADMGAESICDVARVIGQLQGVVPIRFEVFTMPWYLRAAKEALEIYEGVNVSGVVSQELYLSTLAEADALLVAYNFDEESLAYCGLSLGNKIPECLAAGVPVIAYGPRSSASISLLERTGGAVAITERNDSVLVAAFARLSKDLSYAASLGECGRNWVARHTTGNMVRQRFVDQLRKSIAVFHDRRGEIEGIRPQGGPLRLQGVENESDCFSFSISPSGDACTVVVLIKARGGMHEDRLREVRLQSEDGELISGVVLSADSFSCSLFRAHVPEVGCIFRVSVLDGRDLSSIESIVVVRAATPHCEQRPSLGEANRLWRAKGPDEAAPVFVSMFEWSANPIFFRNALVCARLAALNGKSHNSSFIDLAQRH